MITAEDWGCAPGCRRVLMAGAFSLCVFAPTVAFAQSGGCLLIADERNASEKLLRCGNDLTIRAARGTRPGLADKQGPSQPSDAQLDSGALMIEFNPTGTRRNFQILTPHAIAAVRGTKWAVEVKSGQTSTLVISGAVEVGHRDDAQRTVTLRAGEGADISPAVRSIVVKRWPQKRVSALLARFGQ